jgi:hypothetical protein
MIILLYARVNYYLKIPPGVKPGARRTARHWMKSTGGGMSDGTITP